MINNSKRFRENFGRYFEDFEAGHIYEHRPGRTINEMKPRKSPKDVWNTKKKTIQRHPSERLEKLKNALQQKSEPKTKNIFKNNLFFENYFEKKNRNHVA